MNDSPKPLPITRFQTSPEPIAIVGIGCRFPAAPNAEALWDLLSSGGDALKSGYDDRRLDIDSTRDEAWVRRLRGLCGGFLDDIDAFDPGAFNISPREARLIDPQQRLLLETTWEALEDAGQDMRHLRGRSVGVYVGVWGNDYQARLFRHAPDIEINMAVGGSRYAASGRVSYAFGFEGPSLTVDTACSSSLVAIHTACQSLRAGECELALAGGVNLLLDPAVTLGYLHAGALSPDGRCKFGDAAADGYARSEGVGIVVLKTLRQARQDGDPIHAIIRASVVSHTGQTGGSLLAPGEEAQLKLFESALALAGLTPDDLDFIEAHGTGTKVGDRVELASLGTLLRREGGRRSRPCLIGSIKGNIGHTESAAGVAGLIKAVLCLKHRQVPPNLHFRVPNPDVLWDAEIFRIPTALTPIGREGRPTIVAVNSYGITGTFAHVILEAPDADGQTMATEPVAADPTAPAPPFVLPLAALSLDALVRLAAAVTAQLREGTTPVADLVRSAALRRTHHDMRLAVVGRTAEELAGRLESFARDPQAQRARASVSLGMSPPRIGWVFSGQGPQWAGMGMQLYASEPAFRRTLDQVDSLICAETNASVIAMIAAQGSQSSFGQTVVAQPALFAIQVALAALMTSWGLRPSLVVGHSVGEVAAAVATGVLTLEQAARVICARARIAEKARGLGRMAAVELSLDEGHRLLGESQAELGLAAVNGPRSLTLSGLTAPLQHVIDSLAAQGRFARLLDIDYPFHSALLDPLVPEMLVVSETAPASAPHTAFFSTVLGRRADLADISADYWARNLREPVLFAPAVEAMARAGCELFIEISPRPVLSHAINQVLKSCGSAAPVLTTLRRHGDEAADLRNVACELYSHGVDPDWTALAPPQGSVVSLPSYPWSRESYWIEEVLDRPVERGGAGRTSSFPLKRVPVLGSAGPRYWQAEISIARLPWLADHRVRGRATVPAALYIAAAMAVASELSPGCDLDDMDFREALPVSETGTLTLQLGVVRDDAVVGGYRLLVEAAPNERPDHVRTHVTGRVVPSLPRSDVTAGETAVEGAVIQRTDVYEAMTKAQLAYGEQFQGIDTLTVAGTVARAALVVPTPVGSEQALYGLHPVTIDACLQTMVALTPGWGEAGDLWLPRLIGRVSWNDAVRPSDELTCLAVRTGHHGLDLTGDVVLLNGAGELLLRLDGVRLHRVARAEQAATLMHEIRWVPRPLAPATGVFAIDRHGLAAAGPTADERDLTSRAREAVDRLGGLSVQRAFRELGFDFTQGRHVTFDGLTGDLGIASNHRRLTGCLLAILCDDGLLAQDGDGWRVTRAPAAFDLKAELDAAVAAAAPDLVAFWRIFTLASLGLPAVLSGQSDAIEVLFGGEGADLLQELYATHLFWRAPMRQLTHALTKVVEHLPPGQTVRVLEIGAGTGGLTSHLLPVLPSQRTHYVFTDLSSFFFNRARTRFADFPFVSERLFDVEQSPMAQGFEAGQFDVVVAANCLHATRDMRQSVAHAAELLKPGGVLLLQEETASERWTDLIFGLTEGWWRFADGPLRPRHALLDPNAWIDLLGRCGFDEIAVLGGQSDAPCGAAAIVARKRMSSAEMRPWLLLARTGGLVDDLARRLEGAGQPCYISKADTRGPDTRPVVEYLGEADRPGQVIVDLRPTATRISDDVSSAMSTLGPGLEETLGTLRQLIDCRRNHPPRLVLVTGGSQATGDDQSPIDMAQAALWTIARVAALENPLASIRAVDLDTVLDGDALDSLAAELLHPDEEPDIAIRRTRRMARRLYRCGQPDENRRPLPDGAYALEISRRGELDGFDAQPLIPAQPQAGQVQVRVSTAGVNFRDLMNLLGAVDAVPLGLECSGMVTAVGPRTSGVAVGDEVVAVGLGSWRSHFNTSAALTAAKPSKLSHAEAAALPIAYITAHYALRHLANIRRGQSVLVHGAAGGVGLAVLNIALAEGARVLGTAGSAWKRDLVRSLGAVQVFDSRSLRFADDIRSTSPGAVDVVINSFTGDYIPASLDLLAEGGTFIEIGKRNIWSSAQMAERRPDVAYHVIELADLMRQAPDVVQPMLRRIVAEVDQGVLPPLPIRAFPLSEALGALRFMQEARQTGKLVLTAPALEQDQPGGTLITGGLGGLGLVVARWLADRGARRLILVGRSAPGADASAAIDELRARGVEVWVERCDVGDDGEAGRLVERCGRDLPELKGIFHLAGVLDDALVHDLDTARFEGVYQPKVMGAWNLHRLTRAMPIERFVMFSSWTALLGSAGQAPHASANAFLDALAHHRRARGLPAQSINWGGWRDVGSAAHPARLAHLARQGVGAISTETALDALGHILASDAIQVAVSPFDPYAWRAFAPSSASAAVLSALPSTAAVPASPVEADKVQQTAERDLREALREAPPGQARRLVLEKQIRARLAPILRTSANVLDPRKPFASFGLDSLTALELRNVLEADTALKLPASLIFNHATISHLATELALRMGVPLHQDAPADPPAAHGDDEVQALLDALKALPEDDALRLLEHDR